jgi:hypothetical protein
MKIDIERELKAMQDLCNFTASSFEDTDGNLQGKTPWEWECDQSDKMLRVLKQRSTEYIDSSDLEIPIISVEKNDVADNVLSILAAKHPIFRRILLYVMLKPDDIEGRDVILQYLHPEHIEWMEIVSSYLTPKLNEMAGRRLFVCDLLSRIQPNSIFGLFLYYRGIDLLYKENGKQGDARGIEELREKSRYYKHSKDRNTETKEWVWDLRPVDHLLILRDIHERGNSSA